MALVSRRAFVGAVGAMTGYGLMSPAHAVTEAEMFPTAKTTLGQVRGMTSAGVSWFKGIPYGAPTGGKNRWMAPKQAAAWKGVRDCFDYGQTSPQGLADRTGESSMLIQWDRHVGGMGEDCLHLNVWTPGIDNKARPVMVWFHGGGYTSGSGNSPRFDGDPLARFGDVVVVTVNHRLGAFGYLNLQDIGGGEKFANAGSVGLMDLVQSLEWVKANIANFGGDPGKVMIFGQSGGGAKVSSVLAMPSGTGLFHRASVISGSSLRAQDREAAARTARRVMETLGVSRVEKMQDAPWTKVLAAQASVPGAYGPVMNERSALPRHPFDPDAPPASRAVPMMISTTLDDNGAGRANEAPSEVEMFNDLKQSVGDRAQAIYDAYKAYYPEAPTRLLNARILTDRGRWNSYRQADRKAAQGGAPAWYYLIEFTAQGRGGRFGAAHGVDVPLMFHNPRDSQIGGWTDEGQMMADRVASAYVAFARNGDPNNSAIPAWPKWNSDTRPMMVFDINTRAETNYRKKLMDLWAAQPAAGAGAGR
jgi:para-nitrobenzyl esterase